MFLNVKNIQIQFNLIKTKQKVSDFEVLKHFYNFSTWNTTSVLGDPIEHITTFSDFYSKVTTNENSYRWSNETYELSIQVTKKYIYLSIEIQAIDQIPKLINLLYNRVVLYDKYINKGEIIFHANGGYTRTDHEIKKTTSTVRSASLFGFSIDWLFIIPHKGHSEIIHGIFDDTVLLNAPVYETKKLSSGAIMIRLTENFNPHNVDREYVDTFINLQKYLAENIKNREEIKRKEKSYTLNSSELNLQVSLYKNKSSNDVDYIASICKYINFTTIFTDDYEEMEDLEEGEESKNKQIIQNFLNISRESIELAVYESQKEYQSLFVQKDKISERYFYRFNQVNKEGKYNHLGMIEESGILQDPEVYYGYMSLETSGTPPTLLELTTIYPHQNTYSTFGFNIHWWFIIPPKGHMERPIDPFESDDIFLNAPVYKAQRLKSGGTLIQLTENYDYLNPDNQEYIDTLLKFNEYLKNNMKK